MALPLDFAQRVKSSADIVRIIGESVRLKKSGANYAGLCPFHQEKTPSFSVHVTRQFYYCFGCGAKGDVFRFVMEMERVPFPEAVRRVAQRSGIPLPRETAASEAGDAEARLRVVLEKIHERALAFYRKQLQSAEAVPVRELIQQRGVQPEFVEEFGLGFAPSGGTGLAQFLQREGFPQEALGASGLLLRREGAGFIDRFRNRWMFPITSENGRVVAFAGRALGSDEPKYVNSPETPLYSKSRVLYNLSRARDAIRSANRAVLVEGYMDAIAVHQAGVKNVVASCGTSLTAMQVRMLSRYATEAVVNYDPDSAGVAATDRSLALLLEEGMSVSILRLPQGMDPDLFMQRQGAESYRARLGQAQPFFRYLTARALELHGTTTPEAKLACLNFVLPFVAKVPNKLIRAEIVADISQKMDVSSGIVSEAFRRAGLERKSSLEAPPGVTPIPKAEAMLIRLLLDNEEARPEITSLLETKNLLPELELGKIVSALLALLGSGSVTDVTSLADRLEENEQRLLAAVLFDKEARPVTIGEISTYIAALERKSLEKQRTALQGKIKQAQNAQDAQLTVQLLQKQKELDRQLAGLI
ncbi:MAG: DNA primase [Acidobacteria bacterium]|nr:DNA primase [Acidobacteriota bacterium]